MPFFLTSEICQAVDSYSSQSCGLCKGIQTSAICAKKQNTSLAKYDIRFAVKFRGLRSHRVCSTISQTDDSIRDVLRGQQPDGYVQLRKKQNWEWEAHVYQYFERIRASILHLS